MPSMGSLGPASTLPIAFSHIEVPPHCIIQYWCLPSYLPGEHHRVVTGYGPAYSADVSMLAH